MGRPTDLGAKGRYDAIDFYSATDGIFIATSKSPNFLSGELEERKRLNL